MHIAVQHNLVKRHRPVEQVIAASLRHIQDMGCRAEHIGVAAGNHYLCTGLPESGGDLRLRGGSRLAGIGDIGIIRIEHAAEPSKAYVRVGIPFGVIRPELFGRRLHLAKRQ